jgi:hypothetical protein
MTKVDWFRRYYGIFWAGCHTRALLFQQVFEASRGLFRVVFRRVLDSRGYVVLLALAIRTRVVVVATLLIPVVVVVVAARVVAGRWIAATMLSRLAEEDPKYSCFRKDANDVVWFEQRLVVPVDPELRKEIFDEAHLSKFSIHLGSTKM